MYEKILVGLDGSSHGVHATKTAIELAVKFGSELHLLTVTRPYKVSPALRKYLEAENLLGEPKYVMDDMTSAIVDEAKALAAEAGAKSVKTSVREGKPARSIIEYIKNNKIDLVVLGSRGVGELEANLLGSVSHKVCMLSNCSVMIVREPSSA